MSSGHGGGKGRRKRGGHEEEHENHERWLVSYADMMTLLMVLFIVMFAISQVDQKKFAALKDGLASGFGSNPTIVLAGGTGVTDPTGASPAPVDIVGSSGSTSGQASQATKSAVEAAMSAKGRRDAEATAKAALTELDRLKALRARLDKALAAKGLGGAARYRFTDRGLDVVLVSDDVFFASGSAGLEPQGRGVLDAIGSVLRAVPDDIDVEGHANRLPVRDSTYPSNWELSAARAGSVVRYLASGPQIAEKRMRATGFSSTRPLLPDSHPDSLRVNRRVDLVIVSGAPVEVRNLLPTLSAADAASAADGASGDAAAVGQGGQSADAPLIGHPSIAGPSGP